METTKSSVVSIVPIAIKVNKMGAMHPNEWIIPPSINEQPQVLVVEDGFAMVYINAERGRIKTPILSFDLARSIVEDYLRSCICTKEGCEPGIFFIPKAVNVDDVKKSYVMQLLEARARQKRWFEEMMRVADDDWSKSGHKHSAISNLQRTIAKMLGLNKEWLFMTREDVPVGTMKCPACKTLIEADAIVCLNCRLILKPDEHKKLAFVGA